MAFIMTFVLPIGLHCLFHLAKLQISILLVNPSNTFLNLHLNSPILNILKIPILLSIILNNLITIKNLFLQLLTFQFSIVQLILNLLQFIIIFINLFSKRIYGTFLVIDA